MGVSFYLTIEHAYHLVNLVYINLDECVVLGMDAAVAGNILVLFCMVRAYLMPPK